MPDPTGDYDTARRLASSPCFWLSVVAAARETLPHLRSRNVAALLRPESIITFVGAGAILAWLVTVRIGNVSLWLLARHVLPGADAIRGTVRIQLAMAVPIVIATFMGLQRWSAKTQHIGNTGRRRLAAVMYSTVLALLIAETIALGPTHSISRTHELAYLAGFQKAPAECTSFYATVAPNSSRPRRARKVDAALVAMTVGIPTINGPTDKVPVGWDMHNIHSATYPAAVSQWIDMKNLSGV